MGNFNARMAAPAVQRHNSAAQSLVDWLYWRVTLYFSQKAKAIGNVLPLPHTFSLPTLQMTDMNITPFSNVGALK